MKAKEFDKLLIGLLKTPKMKNKTTPTAGERTDAMPEPRFYLQDLDNEQNIPDLKEAITQWPLVGIVDETKGGIIAYASEETAKELIRVNNAFPELVDFLQMLYDDTNYNEMLSDGHLKDLEKILKTI